MTRETLTSTTTHISEIMSSGLRSLSRNRENLQMLSIVAGVTFGTLFLLDVGNHRIRKQEEAELHPPYHEPLPAPEFITESIHAVPTTTKPSGHPVAMRWAKNADVRGSQPSASKWV
ncbi:hypothetical protein FA15DRAFT_667287 [Coprinopsis marcescibilis]|uniref:Uncharacterized protein n=1 Tax=Coprinopsis marcescibilis TaxID=230819 RepID=A0A5C3L0U8_COPMA|nr:hypothetical protein FA15DRAFT_667287 [Coprinopsis marcescibilis]